MLKKNKTDSKLNILHTIPKMTDVEREKRKKMIGDELYEIFLRIQSQLNIESEMR